MEGMRNLRCIIFILEVTTDLKVNLSKSTISLVGIILNVEELASILGCVVAPLPITYLGLPLGAKLEPCD